MPKDDGAHPSTSISANVRVCCRFRPQSSVEKGKRGRVCHDISDNARSCRVLAASGSADVPPSPWFNFDRTFDTSASQEEVYTYTAKKHVTDAMSGFNCTVFAYGQTGAGKSHTMMGPQDGLLENFGIIPRIVRDIFLAIEAADEDEEFTVKVSYVEIYREKIRDLLNPSKANLPIRESRRRGIYVEGATELYVSSVEEMLETMLAGDASRAVASTRMNAASSRSHSVFVITIDRRELATGLRRTGKLSLVDLAGSETVGKTGARGKALEEAKTINKSLSALGNVIKALTSGKSHVPYRDSKLTRILQDSLGGNCKTTMVIACSSSDWNRAETLSTLRFGARAKTIKNRARAAVERSIDDYKRLLQRSEAALKRSRRRLEVLETALRSAGLPVPKDDFDDEKDASVAPGQSLETPQGTTLHLAQGDVDSGTPPEMHASTRAFTSRLVRSKRLIEQD